jgi:hypothetical protein
VTQPTSSASSIIFSYAEITRISAEQITMHLNAARRRSIQSESRDCRERAYGAYLAWRALVGHYSNRAQFHADDGMLESLLMQTDGLLATVGQATGRTSH